MKFTKRELDAIVRLHTHDLFGLSLAIAAADERGIPLTLALCSADRISQLRAVWRMPENN